MNISQPEPEDPALTPVHASDPSAAAVAPLRELCERAAFSIERATFSDSELCVERAAFSVERSTKFAATDAAEECARSTAPRARRT